MKKKVLCTILIFVLAFTFIVSDSFSLNVYADDEEGQLSTEELQDLINSLNNDIEDLIDENDAIGQEISELADKIAEVKEEINTLNEEIDALNVKINEKEIELEEKQEEIDIQETNLNARLKAMYKNGSIGYLDVLLGSHSISEFVYNIKMVKLIHKHDVEVVEILQEEYEELEAIKKELEEARVEITTKKAELQTVKYEYESQVSVLKDKQAEYDSMIAAKKEEVKDAIVLLDGYVGGDFIWPLPSWTRNVWYITSWVGWRWHPVYGGWRYHGGTDIACGTGTAIYAAASGVVIRSSWYGNYGYTVIIDHGGGITTLYGHCSSLLCEVGDVVVAGDTIAKVGMTGSATGPHLHFEVMVDGEEQDSMKYFPDIEQYRPDDVIM